MNRAIIIDVPLFEQIMNLFVTTVGEYLVQMLLLLFQIFQHVSNSLVLLTQAPDDAPIDRGRMMRYIVKITIYIDMCRFSLNH